MAARSGDGRPEIMTVEQVATYLQLNKLTVYKYVRDGRIPAAKLGKSYRIRKTDVDWFLDSRKARPASEKAVRSGRAAQVAREQSLRPGSGQAPARRSEEIAVGPHQPEAREPGERDMRMNPSVNPMEWVIRELH